MDEEVSREELLKLFQPPGRVPQREFEVKNPQRPERPAAKLRLRDDFVLQPPEPKLPDDFVRIGGIPIHKTPAGPVLPDIRWIHDFVLPRPWRVTDWRLWGGLTLNNCVSVPQKTSTVAVSVLPLTRMCKVASNCALAFTVNDSGQACVINVVTENVDAGFTVTPDSGYPYPDALPGPPVVHPFTKGGINNKYKRLYVPASFYDQVRSDAWGGFYVAVVDIDPTSVTYLQTVDYIDCGWIPEEVAFTEDEEIGVIANYMQGTVTIFQASTGTVLAAEIECFDGAAADPGGPYARSVRCANVPGVGNRAFVTLTNSTPISGVAIIDLDDPAYPRTNFSVSGFIDGVAVTPEQDRILLLDGDSKLHVVRVDVSPPTLERTINLPTGGGQSYWGGIAVRPSGNLAFIATGNANSSSATQGTTLVQVEYMAGWAIELPTGLASQTWGVEIVSFGSPLKPHIFVCSLSGKLTIIPC